MHKIKKIAFFILLASLIIITIGFIKSPKDNDIKNPDDINGAISENVITIVVNDINNNIKSVKRINYNENDTLFNLVDNNYDLKYDNTLYGHYLTGIDDIITDGYNSYLWFELFYLSDGKSYNDLIDLNDYEEIFVDTGIDGLKLKENMIFAINEGNGANKGSIIGRIIDINNLNNDIINQPINNNHISNLKIALIIIAIIIILIFIILYIINIAKDKRLLTIRDLCVLSLMAVILFVQEEVLTFIPNIQLTFLLLAVYVSVFGLKFSTFILIIHVLLDNLIMGSFIPVVVIPMFLGYLFYIFLIYLVRNKNLFIKIIIAVIGSLIYCYMFLITNALFLNIKVYQYFIADIPFEILLVLSTIITMYFLYDIVFNLINKLYKKN